MYVTYRSRQLKEEGPDEYKRRERCPEDYTVTYVFFAVFFHFMIMAFVLAKASFLAILIPESAFILPKAPFSFTDILYSDAAPVSIGRGDISDIRKYRKKCVGFLGFIENPETQTHGSTRRGGESSVSESRAMVASADAYPVLCKVRGYPF